MPHIEREKSLKFHCRSIHTNASVAFADILDGSPFPRQRIFNHGDHFPGPAPAPRLGLGRRSAPRKTCCAMPPPIAIITDSVKPVTVVTGLHHQARKPVPERSARVERIGSTAGRASTGGGPMVGKCWTKSLSSSRLTSPHDWVIIAIGSYAENEFPSTI